MSTSAAIIILGVLLVMTTLIVIESRARRPKKANNPDCTAQEAWETYLAEGAALSERDTAAIAALAARPEDKEKLRKSVSRTIDAVLATDTPMLSLRREIMEASDSFLMMEGLSAVGEPDPRATAAALDAVIEAGALRTFARLRFADYGSEDWYSHYLHVAEMNSRNVAAMVKKTVGGQLHSLETTLHEPLTHAMREAREALLHHPPQTPVDRTTKLSFGKLPKDRAPSQTQIDDLTNVMSDRFEKLFGGQIYQHEGGTSLSPAAALQLDAALLFTVLAQEFRQPEEAWKEILEESLGDKGKALLADENLPDSARLVHQAWRRNEGDAPLRHALVVACQRAEVPLEGDRPSADLSHDASLLIGAVQRALA